MSPAAAPWLVRRVAITQVPSAANFVALRAIAGGSRAARPWFGSGDFRPVTLAQPEASFPGSACADNARLFAGLPPLPFAARELALARGTLGGSEGDELVGTGFTVHVVQAADLTQYRVLHFAAHALLPTDLKCEGESALVTSALPGAKGASGALLTASKVSGLKLDADVVILSACNSAGPSGAAGESLSGLARAFFYAGARTLPATHWSVSDQAAAFLVVQPLEGYGASKPIAEALREAELAMLDQAGKNGLPPELSQPFLWAPFAAAGEGTAGSRPPPRGVSTPAAEARIHVLRLTTWTRRLRGSGDCGGVGTARPSSPMTTGSSRERSMPNFLTKRSTTLLARFSDRVWFSVRLPTVSVCPSMRNLSPASSGLPRTFPSSSSMLIAFGVSCAEPVANSTARLTEGGSAAAGAVGAAESAAGEAGGAGVGWRMPRWSPGFSPCKF